MRKRHEWLRWAIALSGTCILLNGCDPSIQMTVEDGIINLSTGLLSSFFAALLQLFTEANA